MNTITAEQPATVNDPEKTKRVSATPSALALIARLTAEHGPIVFLHEFNPSAADVILGEWQNATFYMGDSHFSFAENMHTILDATPNSSGSFSLDCGTGFAFITSGRLYSDEELAQLPPVKRAGLR
jgi:uncharacterized protein